MENKQLKQLDVRVMPLTDLKDHPQNPRTINESALRGLISSIEEFGLIEPIIWNQRTGHIVGGHQRKKALEAAGYTEAQVIVVDFDEGKEMLANISLNNPHIQGEYTDGVIGLIDQQMENYLGRAADLKLIDLRDELAPPEPMGGELKPEVQFTEEIFEEQNYVVLTFKNKADWVWLNSLFPLQTVKALDSEPGFQKQGVGRVVDGVKFLEAVAR